MKTIISTLLALTLTLGSNLSASEVGARIEARNILNLMRGISGLTVRDHYQTGLLAEGSSKTYTTTLTAGLAYTIVAGGDEDALDVDVKVFDESGNLISSDSDFSDRAVVRVNPRWTGTFHIVVTMARTAGYSARYVLQTGFRQR